MSRKSNGKLTDEQRKLWAPILWKVWGYIASDGEEGLPQRPGKNRRDQILELVLDANRPETLGGMSSADYRLLCDASQSDKETKQWLNSLFQNA